jgi:hypothetical protein
MPRQPAIRDIDLQGLLAARQRVEVRHRPVQADQPKHAFHEPSRLPECHTEQHLHRQAGLDSCITVVVI